MTTGLLIVIALVVLFAAYSVGFNTGVYFTDSIWRQWIGERIQVAQKVKVEDLYPRQNFHDGSLSGQNENRSPKKDPNGSN